MASRMLQTAVVVHRPAHARNVACQARSVMRVAPRRAERAGWSSSTNTRRRLAATKSEPGPETSETPAETVEAPEPAETTAEPLAPAAASGDSIDFVVDKADKAEKNISFEGVMAEAGRINWPPLGQVLGSTVLVLALVGSSAFLLLGLNSVLSTASTAIFD